MNQLNMDGTVEWVIDCCFNGIWAIYFSHAMTRTVYKRWGDDDDDDDDVRFVLDQHNANTLYVVWNQYSV